MSWKRNSTRECHCCRNNYIFVQWKTSRESYFPLTPLELRFGSSMALMSSEMRRSWQVYGRSGMAPMMSLRCALPRLQWRLPRPLWQFLPLRRPVLTSFPRPLTLPLPLLAMRLLPSQLWPAHGAPSGQQWPCYVSCLRSRALF